MKKICGLTTLPITIKSFMLGNLNYTLDLHPRITDKIERINL